MTAHPVTEHSQLLIYFAHLEMRSLGKHSNPIENNYMTTKQLKGSVSQNAHDIFRLCWKIYTKNKKKLIKITPCNPATLRIKSSSTYVQFHVMVQK